MKKRSTGWGSGPTRCDETQHSHPSLANETNQFCEKPGITNDQVIFEIGIKVVVLIQTAGEETLGLKTEMLGRCRLGNHHLKQAAIGRVQAIKHMMLAICDYLYVDRVLQLGVSRISCHGFDVELGLASAYALQRQKLLLKSLNSRPWVGSQGTMLAIPFGIPIMNNSNENAH